MMISDHILEFPTSSRYHYILWLFTHRNSINRLGFVIQSAYSLNFSIRAAMCPVFVVPKFVRLTKAIHSTAFCRVSYSVCTKNWVRGMVSQGLTANIFHKYSQCTTTQIQSHKVDIYGCPILIWAIEFRSPELSSLYHMLYFTLSLTDRRVFDTLILKKTAFYLSP